MRVEIALRKIIKRKFLELNEERNSLLPKDESDKRRNLIGDWACWEDNSNFSYVCDELCKKMTQDQFIDQFRKAEQLLLSGDMQSGVMSNTNSVVTIFQERINLIVPNSRVEQEDLNDRLYDAISKNGNKDSIVECIKKFERLVGFDGQSNEDNIFFQDTERLYSLLRDYRNLLISERYTRTKNTCYNEHNKNEKGKIADNDMFLSKFAEAYYYFFLRLLAVFVSAIKIANYSFSGSSLNYANFYSTSLENISLYSAECYRTVFSRARFTNVIMDISRLYDIDFYCANLTESSFNNAELKHVHFEHTFVRTTGFDNCTIQFCEMYDSDFTDCIFNNSLFNFVALRASTFYGSKFREVTWKNECLIENCSFQEAELHAWYTQSDFKMKGCDFSRSVWSDMTVKNWDLSMCVFNDADLTEIKLMGTPIKSASFLRCRLDDADMNICDLSKSTLQHASLFGAKLNKINLSASDLSSAIIIKTEINKCNLEGSNCAEADFSEATISKTKFTSARLYDCSMTKSTLNECDCTYLLADHLQFTFARCYKSDFSCCALSETNFTGSTFCACDFIGADLTDVNATKVKFISCGMIGVDFSGTRFLKQNL